MSAFPSLLLMTFSPCSTYTNAVRIRQVPRGKKCELPLGDGHPAFRPHAGLLGPALWRSLSSPCQHPSTSTTINASPALTAGPSSPNWSCNTTRLEPLASLAKPRHAQAAIASIASVSRHPSLALEPTQPKGRRSPLRQASTSAPDMRRSTSPRHLRDTTHPGVKNRRKWGHKPHPTPPKEYLKGKKRGETSPFSAKRPTKSRG